MNKTDLVPVIVQEECAEVIQAISKVFRFGLYQNHPVTGLTNKLALEEELGQLERMIDELKHIWYLNEDNIEAAYMGKMDAFNKYAEHFPHE